jgi:hypothetical protein
MGRKEKRRREVERGGVRGRKKSVGVMRGEESEARRAGRKRRHDAGGKRPDAAA